MISDQSPLTVPVTCTDGEVMFDDATYQDYPNIEGRLLICENGRFTAICGNNWEDVDAAVACRSLGYPSPQYGQFSKMPFCL